MASLSESKVWWPMNISITGRAIASPAADWFQLSLKEGLTVFRDQSFSADLHGAALNRIENVSMLRNTQFREDAGPTAHPVQPDAYQAIDNFYTTTIYEKGAEVIRALHTLLGEETFPAGNGALREPPRRLRRHL